MTWSCQLLLIQRSLQLIQGKGAHVHAPDTGEQKEKSDSSLSRSEKQDIVYTQVNSLGSIKALKLSKRSPESARRPEYQ